MLLEPRLLHSLIWSVQQQLLAQHSYLLVLFLLPKALWTLEENSSDAGAMPTPPSSSIVEKQQVAWWGLMPVQP